MQRSASCFSMLYVLSTASQRYVQTAPGGGALAGFPGMSGETKARAFVATNKTVFGDHDPWD